MVVSDYRDKRERLAVVFPGQGSQSQGMGQVLIDRHPEARESLRELSRCIAVDLEELLLGGTMTDDPVSVHLALVSFGMLAWNFVIRPYGLEPVMLSGHSLGEITALACAQALSREDALRLAEARGRFIAEACERYPGGMTAFVGAPIDETHEAVAQWIEASGSEERVWIVNYNGPRQIVVAGYKEALRELEREMEARGLSAVPLATAGAFHTPLMNPAAQKLFDFARKLTFQPPRIQVISSMTGALLTNADDLAVHLALQLVKPVRWLSVMQTMQCAQISSVIEVCAAKSVLAQMIASCRDWPVRCAVLNELAYPTKAHGVGLSEQATAEVP